MLKCKACGEQIKKDELFCTHCGKPVNDEAQSTHEEIEELQGEQEVQDIKLVQAKEQEEIDQMLRSLNEEEILVNQEEEKESEVEQIKIEPIPAPIEVINSAQVPTAKVDTPTVKAQPLKSNKVISVLGYITNLILLAIPILGLIMAIIWALGGSKNQNRINLAKAYLVLVIFALVAFVAGGIAFVVSGDTVSTVAYREIDDWSGGFFSKNNIKNFDDFVEIYYKLEHFDEYEVYFKESNKEQQPTTVPQTTQPNDAVANSNVNTTQPIEPTQPLQPTTQPASAYAPVA
ncbi:MAG: hypothetical protein EOM05_04990 [Clostridia bacterium]|nr:hypothetical protein [Clostridia bacterium]